MPAGGKIVEEGEGAGARGVFLSLQPGTTSAKAIDTKARKETEFTTKNRS
jgi:hypothetical protein